MDIVKTPNEMDISDQNSAGGNVPGFRNDLNASSNLNHADQSANTQPIFSSVPEGNISGYNGMPTVNMNTGMGNMSGNGHLNTFNSNIISGNGMLNYYYT